MRIVLDVDFDKDDLNERLRQLKDIENAITVQIKNTKTRKAMSDGESWLKSLPEKAF